MLVPMEYNDIIYHQILNIWFQQTNKMSTGDVNKQISQKHTVHDKNREMLLIWALDSNSTAMKNVSLQQQKL